MAGIFDFLRNNNMAMTQLGLGLLSGRTGQEQAAFGAQGLAGALNQNKTLAYLEKVNPALAAEVRAGRPMSSAWDEIMTQRAQAAKPRNNFMAAGGSIFNTETGDWLTPPQAQPLAAPTSLMRELEAAGLEPGSPEYQRAILEARKKTGMVVESDGQGGFRMTQGVDAAEMPKLNVEQGKNTGFLIRAQDAHKTITDNEGEGTSLWNKGMRAIPGGLGNYGLGENAQKLEQAKRDFINAVLRQESGAVISPEEFANADQQYFPQPGDDDAVIEQKRRNRENAIAGFRVRSGPGAATVDQMQGGPAQQPQQGGVVDYSDYFKQ